MPTCITWVGIELTGLIRSSRHPRVSRRLTREERRNADVGTLTCISTNMPGVGLYVCLDQPADVLLVRAGAFFVLPVGARP
jgi:hypothetical protein